MVLRGFFGVLVGVIMSMVAIGILQSLGHWMYPPPADLDPSDTAAFAAAVAAMPVMALVMVLLSYAVGTFAGAWLATRIGGQSFHAFLVGGVMTLAGISNMLTAPHPMWFTVVGTLVFLPSAWMASRLARF